MATLEVVANSVRRWPELAGGTGFHLVAAVENRSPTSIRLVATDATYRLIVGGREASGRFRYAVPNVIEPGERGYLIDSIPSAVVPPGSRPILEVTTGNGEPVDGYPERLYVGDFTWTAGDDGLRVRGSVGNLIGRPVLQGVVGAVALDAEGRPLAGLVDLTDLSPLESGQTVTFQLDTPQTGPLDPADVTRVEVFAFDLQR